MKIQSDINCIIHGNGKWKANRCTKTVYYVCYEHFTIDRREYQNQNLLILKNSQKLTIQRRVLLIASDLKWKWKCIRLLCHIISTPFLSSLAQEKTSVRNVPLCLITSQPTDSDIFTIFVSFILKSFKQYKF